MGTWREALHRLSRNLDSSSAPKTAFERNLREVIYILEVRPPVDTDPRVRVAWRQRKVGGEWGAPRRNPAQDLLLPLDRRILHALGAGVRNHGRETFALEGWDATFLALLAGTGRLVIEQGDGLRCLRWDSGPPWTLGLRVREDDGVEVSGFLARDEERRSLDSARVLLPKAVVLDDTLAALDAPSAWVGLLPIRTARDQADELIARILELPGRPLLDLPARWEVVAPRPTPRLTAERSAGQRTVALELAFDYGEQRIGLEDSRPGIVSGRRVWRRDTELEEAALTRLAALGVRQGDEGLQLDPRRLSQVVQTLVSEGWRVEVDGLTWLRAAGIRLALAAGKDWFELRGRVEFGPASVPLPQLLEALARGDPTVELQDGSRGVVPPAWARRLGVLLSLGKTREGSLRFDCGQALIVRDLLVPEPGLTVEGRLDRLREVVETFDGIKPRAEPPGFVGTLRPYQREALGWFAFLRDAGLGGCLADDMGLGKTVQVIALLQERRSKARGPSLVVAPRSLVFNWARETQRFALDLPVKVALGPNRTRVWRGARPGDLIVTTYGTLWRDIDRVEQIGLDYAILDEAQAIKNPSSRAARAVRRLRAEHRLALSGTPVENHLGELAALFAFLNPGLLNRARLTRALDAQGQGLLAEALRPFVLRRTKAEVLPDLPPKEEQVLLCDLGEEERRLYDELRDHYRHGLLRLPGDEAEPINVLTALLRLRQAACHPGLIDAGRRGDSSAKLEMLLHRLRELTHKDHKALVFSQFTRLLDLVQAALEQEGITHERLDGSTRDREACVARFQTDPQRKVFLISLKAGGVGLNLTAADYVFVLDPWWNPAVESQAIDRAHRIGQTRPVVAYRLIGRDTVEEKILDLQHEKRRLAEAVVGGTSGPLRRLSLQELERLLC